MSISTKEYSNGEITVLWNSGLCIHSEKCVKGLPNVFNINSSPWINPKKGENQAIIKQVAKCPSGALSIKKQDNTDDTIPEDTITEVLISKNGPIMLSGKFSVINSDGTPLETRNKTFLCRCGSTSNKPFCDGSHKRINFEE